MRKCPIQNNLYQPTSKPSNKTSFEIEDIVLSIKIFKKINLQLEIY